MLLGIKKQNKMNTQLQLTGVAEDITINYDELTTIREHFFAHVKNLIAEYELYTSIKIPIPLNGKLYKLTVVGEWVEHDGTDYFECCDAQISAYELPVWWGLNTDWFNSRTKNKSFRPANF
jgi:hypothetical protein